MKNKKEAELRLFHPITFKNINLKLGSKGLTKNDFKHMGRSYPVINIEISCFGHNEAKIALPITKEQMHDLGEWLINNSFSSRKKKS